MKRRGQTIYQPKERVQRLSVIDSITGCWNWTSSTWNGYGRLIVGSRADGTRRTISAHRYSYESFFGPISEGLHVCHKCDNRKCVNPDHLFLGTVQDNVNDRVAKGRNNHVTGERVGTSKLTETDVLSAKRLREKGLSFSEIGRRFGVGKHAVMRAINQQTWVPAAPEAP